MYRKKFVWIGLGLGILVLRQILGNFPALIERYYSRGLFLAIRWFIDYLLSWLPVPLIYLFVLLLVYWFIRSLRRFIASKRPAKQKLVSSFLTLTAVVGGGVFFFLLLWGFNYYRVPVEDQLGIEPVPLSKNELWDELQTETRIITRLRSRIPAATDSALDKTFLPEDLERVLRRELENWLQLHGFPTVGRVRSRKLLPAGIFLRFSSSGLYFPFTGEGHIDAGLHPLQWPYVMSHELSHGYGFGDEGTCNFLGYLACAQSKDPAISYMGHLAYWRTLAVNYLQYEPEKYRAFRSELPAGIQADLDAINQNLERYPDIMPGLRYFAYDTYLKAQGIDEGMRNYNRVVMLARAWRKSRKS